ncbi:adenine-specific methyltransferase EcoRI family protein [Microbacterium sp. NPDC077057]|uniref:adenine-specific methyltransferase EcoRI family protein n=1 Tax=Microbacterium sp. NPDC077057 TaxID=3154763 RepID=UPI00343ECCA1
MSSVSKNSSLAAARSAKADEFYTQLGDIERELRHYKKHFQGKTVYLNCDDPRVSNFFHYFSYNFETLGLKKLIAACYKSQEVEMFSAGSTEQAIYLVYEGDKNGSGMPELEEIGVNHFEGDGDFRSAESIELLKEADIVVTNPPFSLFREYVAQLMEYDKKFVIVGPTNAITYKELFPLFKENRIWLGNGFQAGNAYFATAHSADDYAKGVYDQQSGLVKFRNVGWFTNLDIAKRHEELILWKKYDPEQYLRYDNYDAIEVSRIKDIPMDWDEAMGVPITFMDSYNPEQFEILGITDRDNNSGLKTKEYSRAEVPNAGDLNRRGALLVDGKLKSTFARLLIRKKQP